LLPFAKQPEPLRTRLLLGGQPRALLPLLRKEDTGAQQRHIASIAVADPIHCTEELAFLAFAPCLEYQTLTTAGTELFQPHSHQPKWQVALAQCTRFLE